MNFLFHRHLAERDLGSAEAALGAMLPDLWRMADRRMRTRPGASLENDLGRGIRHHLKLDSWFHRQPIFLDGQAATGKELLLIAAPRMRLFAHIAWELCLDGALVRRLSVERALEDVRRSTQSVSRDALDRAMRAHRPDADEAEIQAALDRLIELLDSLEQGDWVAGYATGRGLVARLEGVRRRFSFERLEPAAKAKAAERFEALLETATSRLDELLEGSLGVG